MHSDIEPIFLLLLVTEIKMPSFRTRKKNTHSLWIKNSNDGFSETVVIFNEPVAGIFVALLEPQLGRFNPGYLYFIHNCDHVSTTATVFTLKL